MDRKCDVSCDVSGFLRASRGRSEADGQSKTIRPAPIEATLGVGAGLAKGLEKAHARLQQG
jgi:hypothetical protein